VVGTAGLGWWRARPVLVRDATFAGLLLAATTVPGTEHLAAAIGDLPVRPFGGWSVALVVLLVAPLALRRRYPGWCLAVVGAAFVGYQLAGYPLVFATVGGYAALYSAGAYLERGRARVAAGAAGGYLALAVGLHLRGSPDRLTDLLLFAVVLVACWGLGTWVRSRRRGAADRQRVDVAAATGRERARIARELHDIVTHHVTAMVVQADAAQYLVAGEPDRAAAGLVAISDTGRRALDDLRDLLAVLRAPEQAAGVERSPALSRLGELVDRIRAAGQPVELVEDGTPRRGSDGVELTAYRVAQESLTNALKHAPGRRTVVRVGHLADEIRIEVTTAAGPAGPVGEHGHGLLGLTERVRLYGGELRAGPAPDGGFRVLATIPRAGGA
jgi:signal transduction histidine kinase